MRENEKAARLAPIAARNDACEAYFTDRLARTKALLVDAYAYGDILLVEVESIAARMRRNYPVSWAAASALGQGVEYYRYLFRSPQSDARPRLDRGSLPTPARYLRERGVWTGKVRSEWASIRCPAHKSGTEAHPSLRVSLTDGHFRFMTCGAKGGDIIALHRLLTGCGFVQAVRELGARLHD